ncbi:hypothetical protein NP233_g2981 [Leucocoprinus birnbaumii]|uniref:DUF6533 domain-containing protein n=1 Tax=Leucocoprinus birnbaumii TaxID=56174 RepID=A0AAD5W0E5_9AGAR|nr:hypothetical protein NP233_g2981 [Leucocoprinus birnbaumii]
MDTESVVQLRDELVTGVEWTRLVNCSVVATTTIAVLDWILTFDLEVSLVWRSRWTVTKFLYFLARYLPFVDCTLALYHQFSYALPASSCQTLYEVQAWLFGVGAALVELIFTLRTWAVWGKGRHFTYALLTVFCVMWVGVFVIDHLYLRATKHTISPLPQLIGCVMSVSSSILSVDYILLMLYDACLLSLMVIRGISACEIRLIHDFLDPLILGRLLLFPVRSEGNSQLIRIVYSDGIIYYAYVWALSLLNVLVITKLPIELQTLMMLMARVVHAVLACRVVLHIREQVRTQQRRALHRHDSTFGSTSWLIHAEAEMA